MEEGQGPNVGCSAKEKKKFKYMWEEAVVAYFKRLLSGIDRKYENTSIKTSGSRTEIRIWDLPFTE
jgi:hypothetical protein